MLEFFHAGRERAEFVITQPYHAERMVYPRPSAIRVQDYAALVYIEKLRAEFFFQPVDDLGHERLRDAKRFGGSGYAAKLCRKAEIAQVFQLHVLHPCLYYICGNAPMSIREQVHALRKVH